MDEAIAMSEREPIPESSSSHALVPERRTYVRLACDLEATCRQATGYREVGWLGRLHDISRGGIGILATHRFRPGTELAIELRDRADAIRRSVRVRVVHATATFTEGNLCWLLGCAFDQPLSEEEL